MDALGLVRTTASRPVPISGSQPGTLTAKRPRCGHPPFGLSRTHDGKNSLAAGDRAASSLIGLGQFTPTRHRRRPRGHLHRPGRPSRPRRCLGSMWRWLSRVPRVRRTGRRLGRARALPPIDHATAPTANHAAPAASTSSSHRSGPGAEDTRRPHPAAVDRDVVAVLRVRPGRQHARRGGSRRAAARSVRRTRQRRRRVVPRAVPPARLRPPAARRRVHGREQARRHQ